jgi:phosphate/sulfate permease
MTAFVVGVILVALIFDYINGFHDAANSIATVVSTRVLSPRAAVVWAANRTSSKWLKAAAIATISAIGFLGFLIGPPLIGWIAGATNLKVSFAVIVLFGAAIALLVGLRKE